MRGIAPQGPSGTARHSGHPHTWLQNNGYLSNYRKVFTFRSCPIPLYSARSTPDIRTLGIFEPLASRYLTASISMHT